MPIATFEDLTALARHAHRGPARWLGGLEVLADLALADALAGPGVTIEDGPPAGHSPCEGTPLNCLGGLLPLEEQEAPGETALYAGDDLARAALSVLSRQGSFRLAVSPGAGTLLLARRDGRMGPWWLDADEAGHLALPRGRRLAASLAGHLRLPHHSWLLLGRTPQEARCQLVSNWKDYQAALAELPVAAGVTAWRDAPCPRRFVAPLCLRKAETPAARLWVVGDGVARDWLANQNEGVVRGLECWPAHGAEDVWVLRACAAGVQLPWPGHYSPEGTVYFPCGLAPSPRLGRLERFRAVWGTTGHGPGGVTVAIRGGDLLRLRGRPVPLADVVRWQADPPERLAASRWPAFFEPEAFAVVRGPDEEAAPSSEGHPDGRPRRRPGASESPGSPPAAPAPRAQSPAAAPRSLPPSEQIEAQILLRIAAGKEPAAADWRDLAAAQALAGDLGESVAAFACVRLLDSHAECPGPLLRLARGRAASFGDVSLRHDPLPARALAALFWAEDGSGWTTELARSFFAGDAADALPAQEVWLLARTVCRDDPLGLAQARDAVLRRLAGRGAAFRLGSPAFLSRHGQAAPGRQVLALAELALAWCARAPAGLTRQGRTVEVLRRAMLALGLDVPGELGRDYKPRDRAEEAIAAGFAWRAQNPDGFLPPEVLALVAGDPGKRYYFDALRGYSRVLEPDGAINPFAQWSGASGEFGRLLAELSQATPAQAPAAFSRASEHPDARAPQEATRVAIPALTVAPLVGLSFCRLAVRYALDRADFSPDAGDVGANQAVGQLLELAAGVALHAGEYADFARAASRLVALARSEGFTLIELEGRAFSSYHRRGRRDEVASFLLRLNDALSERQAWPARSARLYVAAALYRCREVAAADSAFARGQEELPRCAGRERHHFVPALAHAACCHPDPQAALSRATKLFETLPPEADALSTAGYFSVYQIKLVESVLLGFAGASKPAAGVEAYSDRSESDFRREMHAACGVS